MVKIDNRVLANYLMFKLDKLENEFSEEELASIDELYIDPIGSDGEVDSLDINVLKMFPNLKSLTLANINLNDAIVGILIGMEKLKSLTLDKCFFVPEQLTKMKLYNLSIFEYDFDDTKFLREMINLVSLSLVDSTNIFIDDINALTNLNFLRLSNSAIKGDNKIDLSGLEYLYIEGVSDNLDIFEMPVNLKGIGLSYSQYSSSSEVVNELKNKGINILMNGTGGIERVVQ